MIKHYIKKIFQNILMLQTTGFTWLYFTFDISIKYTNLNKTNNFSSSLNINSKQRLTFKFNWLFNETYLKHCNNLAKLKLSITI